MPDETKLSKYLLGQEHITDREIDALYVLAKNSLCQSNLEMSYFHD